MIRKCKECGQPIKIQFIPLRDYGDLMTIGQFLKIVDEGGFISYDGSGKYAFEDKESDYYFDFQEYNFFKKYDNRFTHIKWYNR